MKNITFSADEAAIDKARARARERCTTLNEEFRRWLAEYAGQQSEADAAVAAFRDLQTRIRVRRIPSRAEMNERR